LSKIVLTDFYTKACGHCREEALIIEELAEVFTGRVEFRMVDAEMELELAEKYVVFSVPTLIIERDGELVQRWNGFVPGNELERALKEALR
jgi:thioredoxin 1